MKLPVFHVLSRQFIGQDKCHGLDGSVDGGYAGIKINRNMSSLTILISVTYEYLNLGGMNSARVCLWKKVSIPATVI